MNEIKYFLGIDFGTTNSASVVIQKVGKEMRTIKLGDEHGGPLPSFVAIDNITGKIFTGREPWIERNELSQSATIFKSLKTFLDTDKTWMAGGRSWSVIEIIGILFKAIKDNAKEHIGKDINEAVVSIPVGFSSKKRKALRQAAELGGITINEFINESSAAFFENYKSLKRFSKVAIFDWGGGTLDVSLVEAKDKKINELAINGMPFGGDDIDYKLAKWIHGKICSNNNKDVAFENVPLSYKDSLLYEVERAKQNLSHDYITSISLRKYMDLSMVNEQISYEEFEELIKIDVLRAMSTLENCVESANMDMNELEAIILIGGSSNLRVLHDMVQTKWTDIHIEVPDDPGWSTAMGTAYLNVYPGSLKLNQDIGLLLSDNTFYKIHGKDEVIPVNAKTFSFGTVDDSIDARFLFSDNTYTVTNKNLQVIESISTQVYGFRNETLELEAEIEEDLTFKARIKSNHKPGDYEVECEISNLRFYYELPNILEEL